MRKKECIYSNEAQFFIILGAIATLLFVIIYNVKQVNQLVENPYFREIAGETSRRK